MQKWWWKVRFTLKACLLPIIVFQFIRTLLLPNPFDVLILFLLFLLYIGMLFDWF
ncbi:hypothetical protein [Paenibacillus contaminans]|uniref:hypothetical protein n=1 Tax=Paenibacillus contaminans TaxID=450362 RepID=UPI0018641A67|nr:hypothetical protein [Paenibacillus contaminans]